MLNTELKLDETDVTTLPSVSKLLIKKFLYGVGVGVGVGV